MVWGGLKPPHRQEAFVIRIRLRAALLGLALLFAAPGLALAHAIVVSSSPALDSAVPGPEIMVTVKFNSRIDHQRSRLSIIDAAGAAQELTLEDKTPVDALIGKATGLAPGKYKVRWQVLAVDGHITRGDIPFTVKAR
jgi:methionine-rich copper-binding protein CopC